MSENPSGSSSSSSKPKAISSLAKRPSEVTRQGTQKLKFVPTLPSRRNKDAVKTEPAPETVPTSSNDRGRGRGRGRGDGRGRGRSSARPPVEMVASGPFAMGPAMSGSTSARRVTNASTPIPTPSRGETASLGSGLSQTAAPKIKTEESRLKAENAEADEEVYSDPDEGVEIVDMENIRQMDWMAPESLRKERVSKKVKKEDPDVKVDESGTGEVNLANALDLSESEDEEELEDIIEDFGQQRELNDDGALGQDRLYFFQFPRPFPTFRSASDHRPIAQPALPTKKAVTFALDSKSEQELSTGAAAAAAQSSAETEEKTREKESLDGIIGHLEVYRSGAVKMRLANGILLDVNAATQPSFLQHAVHLDLNEKKLAVLGEINKQFVVAPDVDALLEAMDASEGVPMMEGAENLISMDVS